jgi:hypothetical protein
MHGAKVKIIEDSFVLYQNNCSHFLKHWWEERKERERLMSSFVLDFIFKTCMKETSVKRQSSNVLGDVNDSCFTSH